MARSNLLIWLAAGTSLALHALIIGGVQFTLPDPTTLFNDAPLEVVLVNSRTKTAPKNPDVLAQADLDGGGNTDANRRLKSPLPTEVADNPSDELQRAAQRQVQLEQQARQLLTQAAQSPHAAPLDPKKPVPAPTVSFDPQALAEQAKQIARLEGEISKDYDAYQKKPRKAFVGARARSVPEAFYVDAWRERIEKVGNLNYPQDELGRKLYGRLRLIVELKSDGTVADVQVERATQEAVDPKLEAAARKILRMAGSFGPFPDSILDETGRHRADRLVIVRTWNFTRDEIGLSTK